MSNTFPSISSCSLVWSADGRPIFYYIWFQVLSCALLLDTLFLLLTPDVGFEVVVTAAIYVVFTLVALAILNKTPSAFSVRRRHFLIKPFITWSDFVVADWFSRRSVIAGPCDGIARGSLLGTWNSAGLSIGFWSSDVRVIGRDWRPVAIHNKRLRAGWLLGYML